MKPLPEPLASSGLRDRLLARLGFVRLARYTDNRARVEALEIESEVRDARLHEMECEVAAELRELRRRLAPAPHPHAHPEDVAAASAVIGATARSHPEFFRAIATLLAECRLNAVAAAAEATVPADVLRFRMGEVAAFEFFLTRLRDCAAAEARKRERTGGNFA